MNNKDKGLMVIGLPAFSFVFVLAFLGLFKPLLGEYSWLFPSWSSSVLLDAACIAIMVIYIMIALVRDSWTNVWALLLVIITAMTLNFVRFYTSVGESQKAVTIASLILVAGLFVWQIVHYSTVSKHQPQNLT